METDITPVTPPTPDADLDPNAPSPEFANALEAFEESGPVPIASDLAPGSRVRGTVLSVGEEYAVVDFGGRSEGVVEVRHFRDPAGALSVGVGDILDLFVLEAGDQVVLGPALRVEGNEALGQIRDAQAAGIPVSGRVTGVNAGGLVVEVSGVRAFCPVSQIEAGFCADPSVYVGRTLEFLVTAVEGKRGAVLSRRQILQRAAAEGARQRLEALKPGDMIEGRVVRLEPFGAFVDLGGVDGMVHVSEIRHERVAHPRDVLREGEKIQVRVLRIDTVAGRRPRIALSIKATAPDPWESLTSAWQPGTRLRGVVSRLADFGAFIALAPGVDGLAHVSEVASPPVRHPSEALTPGDEVEAVVLSVDAERKRVALSLRLDEDVLERVRKEGEGRAPAGRPRGAGGGHARSEGRRPAVEGSRTQGRRPGGERPRPESRSPSGERPGAKAAPARPAVIEPARPAGPAEPTTMAIALRKAMEKARARQDRTPA